jgi:hypothetical protein
MCVALGHGSNAPVLADGAPASPPDGYPELTREEAAVNAMREPLVDLRIPDPGYRGSGRPAVAPKGS